MIRPILFAALSFVLPQLARAQYCQEKVPGGWQACVEGSATDDGKLAELHDVVIDGISLLGSFDVRLDGDTVRLAANGAELGKLAGTPSVLNGIRYDQELAPAADVHVSQFQERGAVRSSYYRNALGVCMKNSTQDVTLHTTLSVGGVRETASKASEIALGERLAPFSCE
jgi:hypothetical protein